MSFLTNLFRLVDFSGRRESPQQSVVPRTGLRPHTALGHTVAVRGGTALRLMLWIGERFQVPEPGAAPPVGSARPLGCVG